MLCLPSRSEELPSAAALFRASVKGWVHDVHPGNTLQSEAKEPFFGQNLCRTIAGPVLAIATCRAKSLVLLAPGPLWMAHPARERERDRYVYIYIYKCSGPFTMWHLAVVCFPCFCVCHGFCIALLGLALGKFVSLIKRGVSASVLLEHGPAATGNSFH